MNSDQPLNIRQISDKQELIKAIKNMLKDISETCIGAADYIEKYRSPSNILTVNVNYIVSECLEVQYNLGRVREMDRNQEKASRE